ncbi:MAG: curli assembly protein CsgF [Balneolia bacterium]|nr:curli assembly protein CsgF [Balneolia bacterium]
MKSRFLLTLFSIVALFFFFTVQEVKAQQMVYRPLNPAFGGNPGNYGWMLQSANAQNRFSATTGAGFQRDPLADFQASLQRQILSQLTRDIVNQQFGEDGEVSERRFDFGEFSIEVVPGLDGVDILITNILTGDQTTVSIPSF